MTFLKGLQYYSSPLVFFHQLCSGIVYPKLALLSCSIIPLWTFIPLQPISPPMKDPHSYPSIVPYQFPNLYENSEQNIHMSEDVWPWTIWEVRAGGMLESGSERQPTETQSLGTQQGSRSCWEPEAADHKHHHERGGESSNERYC